MTRQRRRYIIRRRRTTIGIVLVAAISFLAGMTDAAGLLIAGSFVSFMSGNTTRAAVALSDGKPAYAIILLGALLMFVAGNALGTIIAHNAARRAFRVLITVTLILVFSAAISGPDFATLQFYGIVLAMGLVNAAVDHIDGLPIGLTYVTGALSRFGKGIGSWIVGTPRSAWGLQIVPWIGMATGGVCGAFLERAMGSDVLWLICALSAMLTLLAFFIPPRFQRRLAHRSTPQPVKAH
ncbi:membrane protein [Pararhizobium polonicum]|uniref:Membrane protein n=1 Tax=Pararhizobium polonicum TaxID=1612624 RepID=A0A1C7P506_9HYPH|nr:YoaK family protein [Pararhizobium polonicum]OBZ96338.1 membrane protein [Pararhizobium polonicum]